MKIISTIVGPIETNCYLLIDEQSKRAALIDPGAEAEHLQALVAQQGVTLDYLLLTHGHYDHTTAVPALHESFPDAKIYIHRADANGTGSYLFPLSDKVSDLNFYTEGDTLPLGGLTITVLETPGHSKGSVTLQVENALFAGDTLFAGSCGRTDLAGGDMGEMLASLRRLGQLSGDYDVYPGHMDASTLERERKFNPYLRQAMQ